MDYTSNFNVNDYNRFVNESPKYLKVLELFDHFRAEGIAQLYTMMANNHIAYQQNTFLNAKVLFRENLRPIIDLLSLPYLSRSDYSKLMDQRKKFKNLAYSIGHLLILYVLSQSKNPRLRFYASKGIEYFEKSQSFSLSTSIIKNLIYHSINMDLGEFMYKLSIAHQTTENIGFCSIEELLSICNLLTNDSYKNDFRCGFLKSSHEFRNCKKSEWF